MTPHRLALAASLSLAVGCASNSRKVKLANEAALQAQNHGLWTRPTEIGFKMGGEISAQATSRSILLFQVGESKNAGGGLSIITSGLGGTGAALSGTGEYAAYKAVTEAGAEGIYVTRVETETNGFLFFWKTQKVTVYGRQLTMHDYGPIEQERADDWRFRNFQPQTLIIQDNGSGNTPVQVQVEQ